MAKVLRVGRGWQIERPYDIEGPTLARSHTPTTEQVSFENNYGTFEMETFGFGPGEPCNNAIDIEDLAGYRRPSSAPEPLMPGDAWNDTGRRSK